MGDKGAQAHAGYCHHVGEHLNRRMDVNRAFEMAQSNDEGARGEKNDKSQAHDGAVRYGHMMQFLQERYQGGGDFLLGGPGSYRTPFRLLGGCKGSCKLFSIAHFGTERRSYRARQRQGEQRASCCPESESFRSV